MNPERIISQGGVGPAEERMILLVVRTINQFQELNDHSRTPGNKELTRIVNEQYGLKLSRKNIKKLRSLAPYVTGVQKGY